jgi:hypothetical protein
MTHVLFPSYQRCRTHEERGTYSETDHPDRLEDPRLDDGKDVGV